MDPRCDLAGYRRALGQFLTGDASKLCLQAKDSGVEAPGTTPLRPDGRCQATARGATTLAAGVLQLREEPPRAPPGGTCRTIWAAI
jgi:hypothetical protein